jgi:hypothetical protein
MQNEEDPLSNGLTYMEEVYDFWPELEPEPKSVGEIVVVWLALLALAVGLTVTATIILFLVFSPFPY